MTGKTGGPAGIIVTGGTGALGRALVPLLLERGAKVVVPWRRIEGWKALEAQVGAEVGGQLVGGGIAGCEHTIKYNRLLAIESELDSYGWYRGKLR